MRASSYRKRAFTSTQARQVEKAVNLAAAVGYLERDGVIDPIAYGVLQQGAIWDREGKRGGGWLKCK